MPTDTSTFVILGGLGLAAIVGYLLFIGHPANLQNLSQILSDPTIPPKEKINEYRRVKKMVDGAKAGIPMKVPLVANSEQVWTGMYAHSYY